MLLSVATATFLSVFLQMSSMVSAAKAAFSCSEGISSHDSRVDEKEEKVSREASEWWHTTPTNFIRPGSSMSANGEVRV